MMGVKEIPMQFLHTCDGCGSELITDAKSRPKYWADLTLAQDAYEYQGYAVADGTIKRSLCDRCKDKVTKAINQALKK